MLYMYIQKNQSLYFNKILILLMIMAKVTHKTIIIAQFYNKTIFRMRANIALNSKYPLNSFLLTDSF